MSENVKRISEWLLLSYVLIGFILAAFGFPQTYVFIGMFMGVGVGVMFSMEHYDSVYKQKYIALLEKKEAAK